MKNDTLQRFLQLRDSLAKEKNALERRLELINHALGDLPISGGSAVVDNHRPRVGRPKQGAEGLSLREAVIKATATRPLTKDEILQAVKQLGYRFITDNPLNSLGVVLYGKNPRFRNQGGRFSVQTAQTGGKPGTRPLKSQISQAGRERIAAAQRARWARAKRRK